MLRYMNNIVILLYSLLDPVVNIVIDIKIFNDNFDVKNDINFVMTIWQSWRWKMTIFNVLNQNFVVIIWKFNNMKYVIIK